jgi:endogenous inhibitor of DNA gyrase (YacG/DUF329 family)
LGLEDAVLKLKCPTCGGIMRYQNRDEVPDRPFCSERCRLVDLGKWLTEQYRIRVPAENPSDPTPPPDKHPPDA